MLTRYADPELTLPYPRVRDARGLTSELREYLRRCYQAACPDYLTEGTLLDVSEDASAALAARVLWRAPVLFIGETPPRRGCACPRAFCPHTGSGRHLASLLGRPVEEVGWPENILDRPTWDRAEARARAARLCEELAYRDAFGMEVPHLVVALGRRVARALQLTAGLFEVRPLTARCSAAAAPHPSGASRWWNDPANRRRAEDFFRGIS